MKYNKLLVLCLVVVIISSSASLTSRVYPSTPNEANRGLSLEPPGVKITEPINDEKVPVGNLTVFGTAVPGRYGDENCTVYMTWNDRLPLQKALANSVNGNMYDYSHWNFTYTAAYHPIINGSNNLKSILSCNSSPANFTKAFSVNVTGFEPTNTTSENLLIGNSSNSSSLTNADNSFTNSQEYLQGSAAFRACIDAAANVGNKLSEYEIVNCREDPNYRHGTVQGDTANSGDGSNSDSSSDSSSDSNTDDNTDSSDSGSDTASSESIVCSSNQGSNNGSVVTDGEFNIGAAGDWANKKNACSTVLNMVSKNIDMAIGLGDYAYSTGSNAVDNWWNSVMGPLHGIFKGALGNHDVDDQSTYAKNFGQSGPWYYSFDSHGIHFIAINTETSFGPGSSQYKFVQNDLASASTDTGVKWIVAFFHQPMYTSPSHHPPLTALRNAYHPLFDKYGVDLVLQAHNHNYQRTFPILYNSKDPSSPIATSTEKTTYENPSGQIYAEVGTGGQSSYSLDGKSSFVDQQFTTKGGFLNLAFPDSSTLKGTYYDNDGTIRDQFSVHKSISKQATSGESIYHYNATTTEDTPLLIPMHQRNDKDQYSDKEAHAIAPSVIQPQHGSVRINPNKTLTYMPDRNYFGTDTFAYNNAITGDKVKLASKVSIKVIPINDPPVASDDSLEVGSDNNFTAAVNVLANDTDTDGDSLSISKVYPSTSPQLSPTDGWDVKNVGGGLLSFYGRNELSSPESFRYIVTDGNGGSDTGTVTLRVSKIHKAPTAIDQNLTTTDSTNSNLNASTPMYAVKDSDNSRNFTSYPKNINNQNQTSLGKNASKLLENSYTKSKKLVPELLNFETNGTLTKQRDVSPYPRNISSRQAEIKIAADQAKIAIAQVQAHLLKKSFEVRINGEKSKSEHNNTETQQVLKPTLNSKRESLNQQLSKIQTKSVIKADNKAEIEKVIQQAQILKEKAESSLRSVYPPEHPRVGSKEKLVDQIGTESPGSIGGTPLTKDHHSLPTQNIKPSPIEQKKSFHTTDHRQSRQKIPSFELHSIKPNDHGGQEGSKNDQLSDSQGSHTADRIKMHIPKNHRPHANAGTDRTVFERTSVDLDGTKTVDPDGDRLGYM